MLDPPERVESPAPPRTPLPDMPIDVENVERASVRVDELLRAEFERNLRSPVRVTGMRLTGVEFFRADTVWKLHPSMNVLLGRNGYGKSLVLRTMAGMLQRDTVATGALFGGTSRDGHIELELTRDDALEKLERDAEVFLRESVGKVPLLAIPDSRSTDRSTTTITPPAALDLATEGATHFLAQTPYQAAVDGLLAGLAIDYTEHQTFALPTFELIDDVIRQLTGRAFGFHSIDRVARTGYEIRVLSEGLGRPLLIQHASQGTLSAMTIFGLIHSFLQDVAAAAGMSKRYDATTVLHQEAIVIIDEVDAHLHPAWQQKIRRLLTDTFPGVQFIVSAHSPLVVAGCGPGEVSVLRKGEGEGFWVHQPNEDFVGASAQALYEKVFEIEDLDENFMEYATREATELPEQRARDDSRIDELYARGERGSLSRREQLELDHLVRDRGRISRVAEVREQRRLERDQVRQLERRVAELERELARASAARLDPADA
ncbi:MAG TPA: AAA family ATPase [Solirubrobacteraceae bacterium]|nr:AAA family ATPase [Solirubrobacteraceae bacterium]